MDGEKALENLSSVQVELHRFPNSAQSQALLLLTDRQRICHELEELRIAHTGLQNAHDALKREYDALKHSVVARIATKSGNLPPLNDALLQYQGHLTSTTTIQNTQLHVGLAKRFIVTLPPDVNTLLDVRSEQIHAFLDAETSRVATDKPLARRRNLHIRLARLMNWSAKKFGYPSQMLGVSGVSRNKLRRERGEILWHELPQLREAISSIPSRCGFEENSRDTLYWRTLVSMLAYAGLQLAELCWLRKTDVEFDEERGRIWIGPVVDPTDSKSVHLLKTGNRERHIDIHSTYLLPLMRDYVGNSLVGEVFFFPKPIYTRNRKRTAVGHSERWLPPTLSKVLRGDLGGSDPKKSPPSIGVLPKGITAASLRHTFGSLMLRSGKTYAQIAAAMGNTESVVMDHYARLRGHEVDVDF